jgi:hypothetical protein
MTVITQNGTIVANAAIHYEVIIYFKLDASLRRHDETP